jgi:hypothetical protein
MKTYTSWIVIGLLLIIATGCWGIFIIDKQRQDVELLQIEARRQAALESEAFGAWHHATRYETFNAQMSNASGAPPRSDMFFVRDVWVKCYQKSDAKFLGVSKRYGNAAYQASAVLIFHDKMSHGQFDSVMRKKLPDDVLQIVLRGEQHAISLQCKVEKLDSGEWIASEYKFGPTSQPDFPQERIKEGR